MAIIEECCDRLLYRVVVSQNEPVMHSEGRAGLSRAEADRIYVLHNSSISLHTNRFRIGFGKHGSSARVSNR